VRTRLTEVVKGAKSRGLDGNPGRGMATEWQRDNWKQFKLHSLYIVQIRGGTTPGFQIISIRAVMIIALDTAGEYHTAAA
jgi:hypothetical protein